MADFLTRRKLVSLAGSMAGAAVLNRVAWAAPVTGMTYGVQMFMLREQAKTDLPGVFKAVHEAGFAQIETYPIAYREPAAKLRRMIGDSGLGAVSGHFDYDGLEGRLEYAQALGLKYMVCPMLPKDQWTSLAGFRKAADLFNKVGKGARDRGMQFAFHNHCYEFKPMEGSNGFAVLMEHTDPALVKLELDCYWLTQAGQNPLQILTQHADRAVLIHMKDRLPNAPVGYDMDAPQHFTELGSGTIAWPAILEQARRQGIQYAFLDQDGTSLPIPVSMRKSRAYLRSISA
ncbi:sugar phosphate isomerase/epimerase family protein [Granulicella paludicola]|uniref:sugar phosphate isomerase/epimerase family protein n=1 Tax=Granulicella paludicola TaxID=474951 RepID=UPI0021E0ADCF|nr:sugar phosphate isomerase/epimerase [Granulicella paludicola]